MDFKETTALSDEAIALISPEQKPEMEDPEEVELEDIEYGDEEYDSEPDEEYLDDENDEEYGDEDEELEDDEDEYKEDDDDDYIDGVEIEGIGEVSIDDIIEWRQGNMRQSDYTRKTQELARQREELKDAQELYDYLKTNPQLLSGLRNGVPQNDPTLNSIMSPDRDMLRQIMYNQKAMEVDMKVNELKQKYGEFDEVALFNKATEMGTEDLESVYKLMTYDNRQTESVDQKQLYEQIKQEVLEELNHNKNAVRTTVSSRQGTVRSTVKSLSADERRVAEGLGLSASDYLKWRG